jgi:hypothetical protein
MRTLPEIVRGYQDGSTSTSMWERHSSRSFGWRLTFSKSRLGVGPGDPSSDERRDLPRLARHQAESAARTTASSNKLEFPIVTGSVSGRTMLIVE